MAGTAELLEMILLEVQDGRTVMRAHRVNQMFNGTIKGSVELQKKLWLLPNSSTHKCDCISSPSRRLHTEINPFLVDAVQNLRVVTVGILRGGQTVKIELLHLVQAPTDSLEDTTDNTWNKLEDWLRPGDESWRRMHVARFCGESRDVLIEVLERGWSGIHSTHRNITEEVTVQDLFDTLIREIPKWRKETLPHSWGVWSIF